MFHKDTFTCTYIVTEPSSKHTMILDPVMDFDLSSGTTSHAHDDAIVAYCNEHELIVDYILETHVHADHVTGANYLKSKFPNAKTGIGNHVCRVQSLFQTMFHWNHADDDFVPNGKQFDLLLEDEAKFVLGNQLPVKVMHSPGHTPACVCYVVGDTTVFTGDTLFMPDMGTARCDFPGGSVSDLYHSIQRLYKTLPNETRVFVGHDYGPNGRPIAWETTIGEEKQSNIQLKETTTLEEFTKFRTERDAKLQVPKLLVPSLQINLRNGALPPAESNGTVYLKLPLNVIGN
jgi:glyoxylase-like metal-dependent hydrolase (beta-lactamase superfamily II)